MFATILSSYANLGEIHEKIIKSELQNDVIVVNALIDMYAKCVRVSKARELSDNMPEQYVVSWTARCSLLDNNDCRICHAWLW